MGGRNKKRKKGKPAILIFVEGQTEQAYFNSLRQNLELKSATVVHLLKGTGDWIDKVARSIQSNPKFKGYDAKNVFVIFDKNSDDESQILTMFQKATQRKYKVGFSNNSFELWLLAHFETISRSLITQDKLEENLTTHLGNEYQKGNSKQIDSFIGNLDTAILNSSGVKEFDLNFNSTSLPDIIKEIKELTIDPL
ncbi:MAG: RloB domain-containing protein [Pseudolactococcus raffinolactis]|jgi:hypothetical protein|uniref:RloB family protein n=1 Tax=Pseudolactococcus raffinolactis TaxID=1366 RepID=UPI003A5C2F28